MRRGKGSCWIIRLRRYLHQNVANIKDTQKRVELLAFQMQIRLEPFQTSGTEGILNIAWNKQT